MEFLRLIRIAMVLLLPAVTGIQFQLSPNNINLENPLSNFVNLTCSMTEMSVRVVTLIRIYKESNSGSSWDQIAVIAGSENASFSPSLSNDFRSIMQVSGRLVNNPATDSKLVVSMNASLITCLHARKYRCELNYLVGDEFTSVEEAENATLQATASPSTPYIETVKNLNTSQVINVAQGDTSALTIQVNELLEIVCKADLGTNQNTVIQWSYNSASGSGMIGYNGNAVNSDPVENAGAAASCRYTRTSTISYKILDIDSARSSSNPLIFSCSIQSGGITTQNNPMYTVTISGSTGDNQAGSTANAGSANAGAIAGGIVGGLAFIVIVTLLVYFLWYRRRSTGDDYKTKEEYGSDNPNMAPSVDYAVPDKSRSRRGHENRGLDEPHESNSRRRDYHNGPGRSNYGMDKDYDDYDSRDGSPTFDNDEIGHMGVDPIHGSIGTGV
ncbi:hypothetical protein ACF0H5_011938 [Mactra antiquata]